MPGQDDLWTWLQSVGGDWLGKPYGGHSTNYGPPKGPPPQPSPDALGFSLGVNDDHGDGPAGVMSPEAMASAQGGPPAAAMPPAQGGPYVGGQGVPAFNWPDSSTPTGMPAAPAGSPSATPKPVDSSAKGPLASPSVTATPMKRTAGAPNLGYYQGGQNPRFGTFQYQTPNSSASRAPIYTAMNLFGGGQPAAPAANPNAPSPNAQPVSATAPNAYPGDAGWGVDEQGNPVPSYALNRAPWNMGPLQQGNIWQGSGGPRGRG